MGLDMYLYAEKYVREKDGERGPNTQILELAGLEKYVDKANAFYGVSVQTVTAYWRKANAIHQWFVQNVQSNEDDCGEYSVSSEQLKTLCDLCKSLLDTDFANCEELLPTQDGFFFGGTQYGEYYQECVEYTFDRLSEILALPDVENTDFKYHSSW